MICASSRGGEERRSSTSSSTGGQHHHHQNQRVATQQQVKRGRKKSEDAAAAAAAAEREEQQRRRKQRPSGGRRGKGGGVGLGKGRDDDTKEEGKKKERAEDEEEWTGGRKMWEAWEKRVNGGVVGVEDSLKRAITREEKFEAMYEADPKPIATGMFTNIRRCRSRSSGKEYAAKFSQRNRCGTDCTTEIYHEVALLSIVAPCSRVVHLCDVFETPQEIILVLEYAPGGDLQSIIDDNMVPFESDVVEFVRSLLEGLVYIHEKHIAHLDIKPQNLVMMGAFPDCNIKLCDFEISRVILQGENIREILGTPDYVAPEILHYEPISTAADMWSLGVTTYVLLTGFSPFGGDTDQETFCNISKALLDFPDELFEDVSEQAKDFITRLLVREPSSRPTASECLNHPWISQRSSRSSGPSGHRFLSISAAPSPSASCRDLTLLRKHLSKSREALFERVAGSNLRKALSRSRDRLCGSHLSLVARSRDTLYDIPTTAARRRSRDELCTLLSRSHETLGLNVCTSKKDVGSRVEVWPLPGLQGLMLESKNGNSTAGSGTEGEGVSNEGAGVSNEGAGVSNEGAGVSSEVAGEDSDSEGTVRDWKEETWTTALADCTPAKICDSDGESDKGKSIENEEAVIMVDNVHVNKVETSDEKKITEDDIRLNKDIRAGEGGREELGHSMRKAKPVINISNGTKENHEQEVKIIDTNENNDLSSPEPEEPRYTVAQLISVFNRRWESQQQKIPSRPSLSPPLIPETLFGADKQPKGSGVPDDSRCASNEKSAEETRGSKKTGTEPEEVIQPASEYLRSSSLSSETSGYETPSDASSMASWEEGIGKSSKSPQGEVEEDGGKVNQSAERRGSVQGLLLHHTWGMKVCDGSYSRAMERFGNAERGTEQKGRVCKPMSEQTLEKSHRKCKPLVKPFL